MLDWFKPKMAPEGPVEVELDTVIARSAAEIYPLVDFGDPRHHKAAVGTITRTGPKRFDLLLDMMPDVTFPIVELKADPGRSYTIESVLPKELGVRLERTVEAIVIEPLGAGSCKVTARTTAYFHPMKMKHFEYEVAVIAMACKNSLSKLKIHAEQGVHAIREIEAWQAA
ncbi:hypothetical protein [Aurantiacibacter hainanensis]|uniref:hypothetical protein n=1 Tax=Aurantiacibacter hainanensis TaxID=3076114 RepID=UPI0030C74045